MQLLLWSMIVSPSSEACSLGPAVLAQPSDLGLISLRLSLGATKNLIRIRKISRKDMWFDKLTTLTHSTLLRVILREIEG
jgi:hypothetical protein